MKLQVQIPSMQQKKAIEHKLLFSLGLLFFLMAVFLSLPRLADARFKCWTNSDGVKECGETVPPEYSQQGHQEISQTGIVMDKKEAAKTEEEIAEAKRLAVEELQRQKAEEEKLRQDRVLLETFSSVDDIYMTGDGKVYAINASIKLTQKRTQSLQADLDNRIKQAATAERQGKTLSQPLLKDIDDIRKQIADNNRYIEDKENEKVELRQEYATYVKRYKKLKNID